MEPQFAMSTYFTSLDLSPSSYSSHVSHFGSHFINCFVYIFADPAKVTYTPTVQYLPFRLGGVVQCYIKANPPLQYVTWTKDKRLLEPYQTKDIIVMNNGSLLFTRVRNESSYARYQRWHS